MKKTFKFGIAVATLALIVAVNSCSKTCDKGYEGKKCDTKMNEKFVGTYTVHDTAHIGSGDSFYVYSMSIAASSSDPQGVSITNFGGFNAGSVVTGTVDGTNLSIANTSIGSVAISNASGSINSNTLTFSYTAVDTTGTAVDHAVGLK